MMSINPLALGLTLLTLGFAPSLLAQSPSGDALTDPSLKGPDVIAFIGVEPGWKVADIVAGRFTRALSRAVGPTGTVYAVETAEMVATHPQMKPMMQALSASAANIVVSAEPVNAPLPPGLDAVFIRQDYHDLYDKFMGPANVPLFNRHVFEALKPGGVYVILDHADAAGSGLSGTETRHRIDVARVRADALAAGFELDGESRILANPADDHTRNVFDPQVHGKTDQFLLRFRKPR